MQKPLIEILNDLLEEHHENINPEILLAELHVKGLLSQNEVDFVQSGIISSAKNINIIRFLKVKSDEMITHLLVIFSKLRWKTFEGFIVEKLKDSDFRYLIPNQIQQINADESLAEEVLLDTLCSYYEKDLEYMEKYWSQFCVNRKFAMDAFYDEFNKILQNIEIYAQKEALNTKEIRSYSDIFDSSYKRILLTGGAGYGKSTFVHELARQWRNGDSYLRGKFKFVLLFRLGELKESETLEEALRILFGEPDAQGMCTILQSKNFQKTILLIFDGYDEFDQKCKDICKIITDHHFQATIFITSRGSATANIEKELEQRLLKLKLNGFNEHGVISQMNHFDVHLKENEKENSDEILKVPLFLTIYCILKLNETSLEKEFELYDLVSQYISFLIDRYMKTNSMVEKEIDFVKIKMIIGKLAFKNIIENFRTLGYFDITSTFEKSLNADQEICLDMRYVRDICRVAVEIGFLSKESFPKRTVNGETTADLIFPHQLFASYFAAEYFCKHILPTISEYEMFPKNEFIWSYCSYFSTGIDEEYKNFLWENISVNQNPHGVLFRERFKYRVLVPWVTHVQDQSFIELSLSEETEFVFDNCNVCRDACSLNKLQFIWLSGITNHYGLCRGILNGNLKPFCNIAKLTIQYCQVDISFLSILLQSSIKVLIFGRNDGEQIALATDSLINLPARPVLITSLESIQAHLFRPFFKPLMKFLPNCTNLQNLDIELIDDCPVHEEFKRMVYPENNICATLQSITIRYCILTGDNVKIIETLCHLQNLKEMYFFDCTWSIEASELLVQQFCSNKFPQLHQLCMKEGELWESFQLIIYRLYPERQHPQIDMITLLQSLVSMKDFQKLKLCYCCMLITTTRKEIEEFLTFLRKRNLQPSLEHLELTKSCIRHQCTLEELLQLQNPLQISECITKNDLLCDCSDRLFCLSWFSNLKFLYLSECNLNLCSGHALAHVFESNVTPLLEILVLSKNPELGQCVQLFFSFLFLPKLRELDLHECNILLESCEALAEAFSFGRLDHLSRLILSDNSVVGCSDKLVSSFYCLEFIDIIELRNCGLTDDTKSDLECYFLEKILS